MSGYIDENGKPKVRIHIVFKFKNEIPKNPFKLSDTNAYRIYHQLLNLGFSPGKNKRIILKNCLIFCYDLRVRELPYNGLKSFTEIIGKFSDILTEITISEDKNIKLDWENEEIKEISRNHLD